jgi:hypothetical protein
MAITISEEMKGIIADELSTVIDRVYLCDSTGVTQVSNEVVTVAPEASGSSLVNPAGWSATFTIDGDHTDLDLYVNLYNSPTASGRTLRAQVAGGPYTFTDGDVFVLTGFDIEVTEV